MVTRRPLVLTDGIVSELVQGDSIAASSSAAFAVGSGLIDQTPSAGITNVDVSVAPNPSGVIFVDNKLALDGAAQVLAETALASGSQAAFIAGSALASGNAALSVAPAALASGNAALDLVPTLGGGGGGTAAEFTAASAVASGYAVGVDDAGKVQVVRKVITDNSNPVTFGSPTVFESANTAYIVSTYDSSRSKVFVAYEDTGNSAYGTAVVGTVSGSSISFGTPVVFESAAISYLSCDFDSTNNVVVLAYRDGGNSNYGTSIVGSISGTTVSFGSAVVYFSSSVTGTSVTFDSNQSKVVITYVMTFSSDQPAAIVGTVSGTSISFGSPTTFYTGGSQDHVACFDSINNKVVVCFRDTSNLNRGAAFVGTVSGSTITFGTKVTFSSVPLFYLGIAFDSGNSKVAVVYQNDNNLAGTCIIGSVSGSSISFGTAVQYDSYSLYNKVVYDPVSGKIIVAYRAQNNSGYGAVSVGTISGTSVSFYTLVVFASSISVNTSPVYAQASNNVVVSYSNQSGSFYGTSVASNSLYVLNYIPTLNSYPNVLGISQSTVASGSACLVNLPGTLYNDPAASLTHGAFYYADPTTSGVTTTSTKPLLWDGQVPWNYIGRAVTSSGLMLLKSI